ncbi:MAG: hypothetical protein ACM3PV_03050 [Betaproteobacteria bacterium]
MSGGAGLRGAVAAQALSPETDAALVAAMRTLGAAAGETLEAVVFFGSRRSGAAGSNAFSAYDLFAIVRAYRPFYEALRAAGLAGKSPALLAALSRWLPPTQISLRFEAPELHAKVSVMELAAFSRETSPRRHDHFTIGRLFQPARVVLARSEEVRAAVLAALVSAHAETWRWLWPWLPPAFDAESYGRTALEVSMSWEVRPEPAGRAAALWAAQREAQRPVFAALLTELESRGELQRLEAVAAQGGGGPSFAPVARPRAWAALRLRIYFTCSLLRATARWLKHVVSFEGWLDYIVRKASRHSGQAIELSPRERRWPFVFLWARAFRYLRQKDRKDARP